MKFSVAALIAAVGFADGKQLTRKETGKALLRKAVPVNKDGSRRQLNGEFQISGYDSIKFDDCVSLTWQNENALQEDIYQSTMNGLITPQTSYVTFEVVSTNVYNGEQSADLWMLPLMDWVAATSQAMVQDAQNYCDACDYDQCVYGNNQGQQGQYNQGQQGQYQQGQYQQGQYNGQQNGGGRMLQNGAIEYVDCSTCQAKGCFDEQMAQNNGQEVQYCEQDQYYNGCVVDPDDVAGFLQDGGCFETGMFDYSQNGGEVELMAGLMCNSDGSGVELALFADEECSLYMNQKSFVGSMQNTYLYALAGEAAATIMDPYINSISCEAKQYAVYDWEEAQNQQQEQQNNNGEAPEASEACQNIMQEAADIYTCGGEQREYNQNQNEQQQNYDMQYPAFWDSLDFTDGEEPDANDVCWYVHDLGEGRHGKHTYDDQGGNFFDFKRSSSGGSSSAGKTFGIIIAVAVVVVAGVLILQNFSSKRDAKKTPLVGNNNGAMA